MLKKPIIFTSKLTAMGQIKERIRKQINAAAGNYLSEQDDGDLYDAYLKLKDLQTRGKGDRVADDYIEVWQPIMDMTIDDLIDLIEGGIVEPEVPEFLKNIDWNMLRTQKASLVAVIGYYRHNDVPFIPEHLEGILALLDAVQDYAIDDVEIVEAIKEDQEFINLMNTNDEIPERIIDESLSEYFNSDE